jgi:hypothetical protein
VPTSRAVRIAKTKSFLVGLSSGVLLVANWRSLLKVGIKTGLRVGSDVQRAAARGAENLADIADEARAELLLEGLNGDGSHGRQGDDTHRGAPTGNGGRTV